MASEIWRSPNEWVLVEASSGELILCVNCGAAVGHQANHVLSFEERDQYLNAGWVYLDVLAAKIVSRPWAYITEGAPAALIDFTSRGDGDVYIPPGR